MTIDSWDSEHAERVGLPVTPIKPPAPHRKPQRKVAAVGWAGSASVLLIGLAGRLGLELTAEEAAAVVGIVAFAAGYLKRG